MVRLVRLFKYQESRARDVMNFLRRLDAEPEWLDIGAGGKKKGKQKKQKKGKQKKKGKGKEKEEETPEIKPSVVPLALVDPTAQELANVAYAKQVEEKIRALMENIDDGMVDLATRKRQMITMTNALSDLEVHDEAADGDLFVMIDNTRNYDRLLRNLPEKMTNLKAAAESVVARETVFANELVIFAAVAISWEHGMKSYHVLSYYLNEVYVFIKRLLVSEETSLQQIREKVTSRNQATVSKDPSMSRRIRRFDEIMENFKVFLEEHVNNLKHLIGGLRHLKFAAFPMAYEVALKQMLMHGSIEEMRAAGHLLSGYIRENEANVATFAAENEMAIVQETNLENLKKQRIHSKSIQAVSYARYLIMIQLTPEQNAIRKNKVRQTETFSAAVKEKREAMSQLSQKKPKRSRRRRRRGKSKESVVPSILEAEGADSDAIPIPDDDDGMESSSGTTTNIIEAPNQTKVISIYDLKSAEVSVLELKSIMGSMYTLLKPEWKNELWNQQQRNVMAGNVMRGMSLITRMLQTHDNPRQNESNRIFLIRKAYDTMVEALMSFGTHATIKRLVALMEWEPDIHWRLFDDEIFNKMFLWSIGLSFFNKPVIHYVVPFKVGASLAVTIALDLLMYFRILGEVKLNSHGQYAPWDVVDQIQRKLSRWLRRRQQQQHFD